MPPRTGLYRRTREGFEVVEETEILPEIAALVRAVRAE
jgi:hypothetical protein